MFAAGFVAHRLYFHPLASVPGPKIQALFYFPHLYRNQIAGVGPRYVAKLHRQYGPVVRIGPNHLSVDGAIGWPEIYAHQPGRDEFPKFSMPGPGLDNNLISADRPRHRRLRKQLNPSFSDAAVTQQETTMTKYVDAFIDRLAERAGTEVNIVDWLNFTTFDIVGDLAFSSSFDSLANNGYHPWVKSIFESLRSAAVRRFLFHYPLLNIVCWCMPTRFNVYAPMMQLRGRAIEKATARLQETPDPEKRDYVAQMLKPGKDGQPGLQPIEILSTSPVIVIAGSETTATAQAGLYFLLAQHPEVLVELKREIRNAFDSEAEITIQSTARLEYLSACLNETMRIYPAVPETPPRFSPGAMVNNQYIPPKTTLSVYQYSTYRNPEHFADAESFLPQRWLLPSHYLYDHKFKDDRREVFKPFSYGTRDCIGRNLAQAEMRLMVARMLYRFDYTLCEGQEDWQESQRCFLLWEKQPLLIKVTDIRA